MKAAREEQWQAVVDAGASAFRGGNYGAAEQHFQQAFKLAQEWELDAFYSLWSFDCLMLVYRLQGKEDEAEALRKQAVAISERLHEQAELLRQSAATSL